MFVDRKFRLARYWSNQELKKIGTLLRGRVINVSGWKDEDKEGGYYKDYFPSACSYTISNYGGFRGYQGGDSEIFLDLAEPLPKELIGAFDVIFNHTTLEHIFDVRMAFKNLCLMSQDIVIVVVPFAQVQHEYDNLKDFWRFSPTCLHYLFKENGMTVVYESINKHRNAGVYIFMVGSKRSDVWSSLLPKYEKITEAAFYLGASRLQYLKKYAQNLIIKWRKFRAN
jgi:hypothetical protein